MRLPVLPMGIAGGNLAQKSLQPLALSPDRITRSATVYAVFAID
jgi:hypothetical protein